MEGKKGEDFIKSKIENFQRRCEDDKINVEVTWFQLNYWKPVKVLFFKSILLLAPSILLTNFGKKTC